MIPIYMPYIDKYTSSAQDAISTNWISNYGIYVTNAEEQMKKIMKTKFCILMNLDLGMAAWEHNVGTGC